MSAGNVAVMLVYEPHSTQAEPVPIVRITNEELTAFVARAAVSRAFAQAREMSELDELLGEVEKIEASRLRRLLKLLVPGFNGIPAPTPKSSVN